MVDASIRGPIYLLNMLSTISYLFQNTFCKNANFLKSPPIEDILGSIEENEYAGIKYPINLKHTQKHLVMAILTQSREIAWIPIFCNFKMSVFKLTFPVFFNKKNPHSPDFQKFRLTGLTNILINT